MSASAMSSFLEEAKKGDLPDMSQRKHIKQATQASLPASQYGPMFVEVPVQVKRASGQTSAKTIDILLVNVLTLLQAAFGQGGSFYQLISDTLKTSPCSLGKEWKVLLYSDEIQPGQTLGIHAGRKCCLIYMSILDFGPIVLSQDLAWLPICVIRSSLLNQIAAGVSQVFVKVLEQIFTNPACDVGAGLRLKGPNPGEYCTLFLAMGGMISDGLAQKQVYASKGDCATKACILCANLYAEKSTISGEGTVFTCKLMGEKELIMCSDDDIKQTIKTLIEKKDQLSTSDFKLWEQSCGFNFEPCSLLFAPSIAHLVQPSTQYIHDWMHCICCSGVWHTCFNQWLEEVQVFQDVYGFMEKYLQEWHLPKGKDTNLHRLFTAKRKASNKEAKTWKSSASESLGLMPIMCFYIQKVLLPASVCKGACHVILALVELVELLQAIPVLPVTPSAVEKAVSTFYRAVRLAQWESIVHAKFHWLQHLSLELSRFHSLPNCWVHERKHKGTKAISEYIFNTTTYEQSILEEVVAGDLHSLQAPDLFSGKARLEKMQKATKKTREILAQVMSFQAVFKCSKAFLEPVGNCSSGDVVMLTSEFGRLEAGRVQMHFEVDGQVLTLISTLQLSSYCPETCSALWQADNNYVMISTTAIKGAMVWAQRANNTLVTLVPLPFRPA